MSHIVKSVLSISSWNNWIDIPRRSDWWKILKSDTPLNITTVAILIVILASEQTRYTLNTLKERFRSKPTMLTNSFRTHFTRYQKLFQFGAVVVIVKTERDISKSHKFCTQFSSPYFRFVPMRLCTCSSFLLLGIPVSCDCGFAPDGGYETVVGAVRSVLKQQNTKCKYHFKKWPTITIHFMPESLL